MLRFIIPLECVITYRNHINFRGVLNFTVFADAGRTAKLSPSGSLMINNRPRTCLSTCTNNGTLKILGKTIDSIVKDYTIYVPTTLMRTARSLR